jgi:hypothetical protein
MLELLDPPAASVKKAGFCSVTPAVKKNLEECSASPAVHSPRVLSAGMLAVCLALGAALALTVLMPAVLVTLALLLPALLPFMLVGMAIFATAEVDVDLK